MAIQSLIILEQKIFKEGISVILREHLDIKIKMVCPSELMQVSQKTFSPDIIIIEIELPRLENFKLLNVLSTNWPKAKICAMSSYLSAYTVYRLFNYGVNGYFDKQCSADIMVDMIKQVLSGKRYLSRPMPGLEMASDGSVRISKRAPKVSEATLTPREFEVLKHILSGLRPREIAEICKISIKTYETHRNNITNKTNIKNLAALTKYAIREGVITLD